MDVLGMYMFTFRVFQKVFQRREDVFVLRGGELGHLGLHLPMHLADLTRNQGIDVPEIEKKMLSIFVLLYYVAVVVADDYLLD